MNFYVFLKRLIRNFKSDEIFLDDEDDYREVNTINPMKILVGIFLISLLFGLFLEIDKFWKKREPLSFKFVCNNEVCKITNFNTFGDIVSEEDINDISKVKKFIILNDKLPLSSQTAMRIYIEYDDGTQKLFSPIYLYFRNSGEYLKPLNRALKEKPLDINVQLP